MAHYRCEYTYSRSFSQPQHIWQCVGAKGAIHLHITDYGEKYGERYSGGIEIHYRTPPDYMASDAPSHDECRILKCPCWHDGSSLQASEIWIPFWLENMHDHEGMFRMLEREMKQRFGGGETDAEPMPIEKISSLTTETRRPRAM